MKLSNFIEGLAILRSHYEGGDGYCIGAEHDEFYAYQTKTPLTTDEVAKMHKLGWFQENVAEGEYDKEEGWTASI